MDEERTSCLLYTSRHNIINLEDFGCPKLEQLRSMHRTARFAHRLFPEICTNHRVHALREWVVSDVYKRQGDERVD